MTAQLGNMTVALYCTFIGWTVVRRTKFILCFCVPVCRNARKRPNGLMAILTAALYCYWFNNMQKDKIYVLLACASLLERQKREPNGLDLQYENIRTLAIMCWALIVAKVYVCKRLCINLYKTILWISTSNLRFCTTPNYYHQ